MKHKKIYRKNEYGIDICMCCASCSFCKLDKRARICMNGEGIVPPSYVCYQWEMRREYRNAGKGDGRVKSANYLQYALRRLGEEDAAAIEASEKKVYYKRAGIDEIREEYKEKFGTIYIEDL